MGIQIHEDRIMSKTIVITGASRGLGFDLTEKCLKAGHFVITISRNQQKLQELLANYPDSLFYYEADLSSDTGIAKTIKAVQDFCQTQNRKIDILVNNAATVNPLGPIHERTAAEFDNIMNLNVKAPMLLSTGLLEYFANNDARILNMSSRVGHISLPGLSMYCMSKHALVSITGSLQKEFSDKIAVAHLIPGKPPSGGNYLIL